MSKFVYFVRHGETMANRRSCHQGPDEPLSDNGQGQAKNVSKTLASLKIDTLVCSSYVRARQTAEIIGEELDLPLIPTDTVVEFRRPNKLYGQRHYSLGSFLYVWNLFWHQEDPEWNNDGAENLFQIRNRMESAKNFIEDLPGQRIAVVSHAIFMDMFKEMVCKERDMKLFEFAKGLALTKRIKNTGILAFGVESDQTDGVCNWQFLGNETSTTK